MTSTARPIPTATTPTQGAQAVDERYLAISLDAVEARTQTKFEQLLGEIKLLAANVAHLSTDLVSVRNEVGEAKNAAASGKTYVIGTGIALAGFMIGVFAFGWQILDAATGLFQAGAAK